VSTAQPRTPAHHAFWPKRVPHAMTVPSNSLWENLAISTRRFPAKTAMVFFKTKLTYAELSRRVDQLAAALQARGVGKGDRVAVCMQNCPQLVISHFAVLRANAVVVPVNPMNRLEEIKHYITDPDVKVALTTADLATEWAQASDSLPAGQGLDHLIVTQWRDGLDEMTTPSDVPPAWQDWLLKTLEMPVLQRGLVHPWLGVLAESHPLSAHTVGADDLAILPYTSGTTGLPKGCMHPHRTVMHNVVGGVMWSNGTHENVSLCVVPLFHATGLVGVMHATLYVGGTLVLMPRWDRDLAGRLISSERVTHWTNIPTMVIDLLASPHFESYDLSGLVAIGGGGAAMPQAVAQRLWELYGLRYAEGYGLTETAAPSHSNPPDHAKQQCLGIPFIGVDSRVVNPDTLEELPTGEAGEIVTSGPMVFDGYWKRPDATAAVFFERDGKRFFRTGDLGRIDEDGYFFLTDRLKRMINASGFKVWPAEVEALMFGHPAIQEACIISAKDAYRGETVKAVVVLRAAHKGAVSEQDIIDWCRDHMAVYKVPRIVEFVDALPKSGSGKVMWRKLQEAQA